MDGARPNEPAPRASRALRNVALAFTAGGCMLVLIGATFVVWVRAEEKRLDPERKAIGALRTIVTSQMIFREGDKDQNGVLDYGTLEQLSQTQLIDTVLGSGTKCGYVFRAAASCSTSEFLWWATAEPLEPEHRLRYFYVNEMGVIYRSNGPIAVDTNRCDVPAGLVPVGRD